MATLIGINDFSMDALSGTHDFTTDDFEVLLSNTAPGSESSDPTADGNGVTANVTQIAYTNYTDDLGTDRQLEGVTLTQSGDDAVIDFADFTMTASGAMPTFRYIYVANKTAAGGPLVVCIDYDSALTLADAEALNVVWNVAGLLTLNGLA